MVGLRGFAASVSASARYVGGSPSRFGVMSRFPTLAKPLLPESAYLAQIVTVRDGSKGRIIRILQFR